MTYSEMARWRQISRSSLHLDVCDLKNIAHPRGRVIDWPLLPACCSCPVLPPPDAISDSAVPPIAFRDDDCGIHARCSAQAVVGQTRMYRPGHLRVPGIPVERDTSLALHPDEGFRRCAALKTRVRPWTCRPIRPRVPAPARYTRPVTGHAAAPDRHGPDQPPWSLVRSCSAGRGLRVTGHRQRSGLHRLSRTWPTQDRAESNLRSPP